MEVLSEGESSPAADSDAWADVVGRCRGRAYFDALQPFPFGSVDRCAQWLAGLAGDAETSGDDKETCL